MDGELIRSVFQGSDDLKKLGSLKADLLARKLANDDQLRVKREELLRFAEKGMHGLGDAQQIALLIKSEMSKIARLGAQAEALIKGVPNVHDVATLQKNFQAVQKRRHELETFQRRVGHVHALLEADENDDMHPNMLNIHFELSKLRQIEDEMIAEAQRSSDRSYDALLMSSFRGLDEAVETFDRQLDGIMIQAIKYAGNDDTFEGVIVRLAVIIDQEEERDERIEELQSARRDYAEMTTRFKTLAVAPGKTRGYKRRFFRNLEQRPLNMLEEIEEKFFDEPEQLDKHIRWFYNDLNTSREGLTTLVPSKWEIFPSIASLYHRLLRAWLENKISDESLTPVHMLAVIHFKDTYHTKMVRKLKVPPSCLEPPLPGGKDSDLVREYRHMITDKVEQWLARMGAQDRQAFESRKLELSENEYHHFYTKSNSDLWIMLREQLAVANASGMPEITEGVIDTMFRSLKVRQDSWAQVVNGLIDKCSSGLNVENLEVVFDWLLALSNDAVDLELRWEALREQYEPNVSKEYASIATAKWDSLKEGSMDLILLCVTAFIKIIFSTDLQKATTEIFTSSWVQGNYPMPAICEALGSYLQDYMDRTPSTVGNLLIQAAGKQLLISYLGAVRNKSVKFKAQDSFENLIRQDVQEVFRLFEPFQDFELIREQWAAVQFMSTLVQCPRDKIAEEFEVHTSTYRDMKLSWVEAVLRCREDLDFGPLGSEGRAVSKQLRAISTEKRQMGSSPSIFGWLD